MRQQHYLIPTLRDNPADAEVVSHQLLVRAGFLRQLASGIYTYLPLGYKVLRKVEQIVREEMDKAGAQEVLMPALHPAELWQETGRWNIYGPELMRLSDRHDRSFALGPTHEEVITSLLRDEVKSYKRLPMNLYQIQTKFRDERRPRFGMLRSREFIMKDAYSFDTSAEGLDRSYQSMYNAYTRIFTRCGLNFRAVEADSGAIGGTDTHEFMVLSEIGEDTIAYCDVTNYAANVERAEVTIREYEQLHTGELKQKELIHTPDVKNIEQLSAFLKVDQKQIIKAVALLVDDSFVVALVRGDYEINEIKVKNLLGANMVELLDEASFQIIQSVPGFLGPIELEQVKIIADYSIKGMSNVVIGANKKDYHYVNVQPEQDFSIEGYYDLRMIEEGDPSPAGNEGSIRFAQGIEVGHVFKLGTKYSEAMGASFLDENGKEQPMIMGCYGIGISRTVAAIVEQNHDEHGIVWPLNVAPYHIHLIAVNMKSEEQKELAEELYTKLLKLGYEVLFDDRQERPGVKFKDADLLGLPIRVTVGKKAAEGIVECKLRKTGEMEEVQLDKLEAFLADYVV